MFFVGSGEFAGIRVETGVEVVFDLTAAFNVGDDERHEVLVTVLDGGFFDGRGFVLAGPDRLASGPVPVEPGATGWGMLKVWLTSGFMRLA
ncbi:hypothetical protein [Propionibacterium freudenreichii]|uniref:hypothetical protein n=1 Tax=Propionibacterium freudenreichii TaxID=1744 RepID=UPI0012FE3321|nr:hypothetical protein [Propionibacterium freudenreichii]MDK9340466.1 hypothetical protein [Propionibacterium freudenreichii]MDK9649029.1 hypothetical protein [Propionibacterium freudenreichii]